MPPKGRKNHALAGDGVEAGTETEYEGKGREDARNKESARSFEKARQEASVDKPFPSPSEC